MKYSPIQNYRGRQISVAASSSKTMDVVSPLRWYIYCRTVPMSSTTDPDTTVRLLLHKKAFPAWSKTPIKERVQVFFKYKTLAGKTPERNSLNCAAKRTAKPMASP